MSRLTFLATSVACCVVVAACQDNTGPKAALDVSVAVKQTGGPWIDSTGNNRVLHCDVTFEASAVGHDTKARWDEATFYYYAGAQRKQPFDSITVAASDVQSWWRTPTIGPGETQDAVLRFALSVTFGVKATYRYTLEAGGATKSASTQFDCGWPVPNEGAPLPTISSLTVSPSSGTLEVGDSIDVTYTASSPIGLWSTQLTVGGSFNAVVKNDENLPKTITRTQRIGIPPNTIFGNSTVINLKVTDAALQEQSSAILLPVTFVDTRPPTFSASLGRRYGFVMGGPPSGEFTAGDTMVFNMAAADNRGLAATVYDLSAPANVHDSIDAKGVTSDYHTVRIVVPDGWTGPATFRGHARDVSGNVSAELVSPPDSIRFYPTVHRPARSAVIDGAYRAIALDAKRQRLFVVSQYAASPHLTMVSLSTMAVEATIPLPEEGADADIAPNGDALFVTLPQSRTIAVVDLTRPTDAPSVAHVAALDSAGLMPNAVRVAANGKVLLTVTSATGSFAPGIVEWTPATGVSRFRADAGGGQYNGLRASLDRSRVYAFAFDGNCMVPYDAAADAIGSCIRTSYPLYTAYTSIDAAGQHFTDGVAVYDDAGHMIRNFFGVGLPFRLILDPAGDGFWFCDGIGIVKVQLSDGRFVERVPVPSGCSIDQAIVSTDGSVMAFVAPVIGQTFQSRVGVVEQ